MRSNTLIIDEPSFLVEPGGAGHLVDLLRHVGEQQRHAEVLSNVVSSSWSLYEMSIVPPGTKLRASMRGTRFSNCALLPGTDAHDLIDLVRVEPGLDAVDERLGDRHGLDLAEHVVQQLHRQSMPEPADMEHILAHRAEQVLAGRKNR